MAERNFPKCVNDDCGRPMRPRGASAEAVPGTVAMGHKGQCKTCVQPATRARRPRQARQRHSEDVRVAYTVSGLESFLARRYARGVLPEATLSIAYRPAPLADIIALPAPAAERELVAA
jgi:hypothetical protein